MIPNLTGSLSSVINMVPFPGTMTIIPLERTAPIPIPAGLPYVVMFNPERIQESMHVVIDEEEATGSQQARQRFVLVKAPRFSFDFLIDGTGASGDKREVELEIGLFKETVSFNGKLHRAPILLLIWGTYIATAVLTSMQIEYKMFRPNGTPLRALIRCQFAGHAERILELLISNLLSSDLTHQRTVREGDTLPNMCNQIYESPRFYLEVARTNGLTNFRRLKSGSELFFPPVEK